jgi:hypothetical protein
MKIHIWKHPDGTEVIELAAETPEDERANTLLFGRYNKIGIIGSASGNGARLQLLILPLSPEEIRDNAIADSMISAFGGQSDPDRSKNYIEVEATVVS